MIKGLPRAFWYVWTAILIDRLGTFVFIYFAFYLTKVRGLSLVDTGLVLSLIAVGSVAGNLLGGFLTDRWGRRRTAIVSSLSRAVLLLCIGFTTSLGTMAVLVFALGLAQSMFGPVMGAIVADLVPEKDRVRAFALQYWAINIAFSGAAILAGQLSQFSYFTLFAIDAASSVAVALIFLLLVPETLTADAPATVDKPRGGIRTILSDRVFLIFLPLAFATALVFRQSEAGLPMAVVRDGLGESSYSLIIVGNGLLIVAGQLFLARMVNGRNTSVTLGLGTLVLGAGFGLTALADTVPIYILTVLIWTCGEMLYYSVLGATVASMSPPAYRGRYSAAMGLCAQTAALAAPNIAGYTLQYHGEALWIGSFAICLVAAAGFLLTGRARTRRIAELAAVGQSGDLTDRGREPVRGEGGEPDHEPAPGGVRVSVQG